MSGEFVTKTECELKVQALQQEMQAGFQRLEQKIDFLVEKTEGIDKKVDRIEKILYGNGSEGLVALVSELRRRDEEIERILYGQSGRNGLIMKVANSEVKLSSLTKLVFLLLGGMVGLFFWVIRGMLLK